MKSKYWKIIMCVALVMMVTCLCSFSVVAASADTGVAGDVAGRWKTHGTMPKDRSSRWSIT